MPELDPHVNPRMPRKGWIAPLWDLYLLTSHEGEVTRLAHITPRASKLLRSRPVRSTPGSVERKSCSALLASREPLLLRWTSGQNASSKSRLRLPYRKLDLGEAELRAHLYCLGYLVIHRIEHLSHIKEDS